MKLRALLPGTFLFASVVANAAEPVTGGDEIDYMPSVIRSSDDDARIVVFERLDASTFNGDLWITRSTDGGASWSTPSAVVATAANERHPSLVQLGPASYALFYLKGSGGLSSLRIYRATSSDGVTFSEQGVVDLGWASGGQFNPHVIRHPDGTLTMSYQYNSGSSASYVAQSADGGATWDPLKTPIAAGSQLPRIAFRASDGLYLASYQVGGSALSMYVKTTTNVHDWSAAPQDFAVTGNNHDSLPVVMPDDAFALFWIRANGGQFDLAVRRSADGVNWGDAIALSDTPDEDDVEPHPLVGTSSTTVELYWGRDTPAGSLTHDIVREPRAIVVDAIFADGLDPA
ncbi:MAG TPA: sialidase family protein [Dokdonella sp.]|nr:sialidase family protein [Dokdonella sp.]